MVKKIVELAKAAALVPDGATISFGGFTTQRHPMAFVYELIRLKRRNLYFFGHSPGGDWDMLIGAGCVKRVELAYEADEAFNTIGWRWRLAVQRGQIEWEDYSNFAMVARFTAGAMGIPFMPVRTLLGSDILHKQALTEEQRAADPRTAAKKLHVMVSPFNPNDRVVLVPAIHTDFAVAPQLGQTPVIPRCVSPGTVAPVTSPVWPNGPSSLPGTKSGVSRRRLTILPALVGCKVGIASQWRA